MNQQLIGGFAAKLNGIFSVDKSSLEFALPCQQAAAGQCGVSIRVTQRRLGALTRRIDLIEQRLAITHSVFDESEVCEIVEHPCVVVATTWKALQGTFMKFDGVGVLPGREEQVRKICMTCRDRLNDAGLESKI